MTILINIEGNIGVGKTTLLNLLKTSNISNSIFIEEPIYECGNLFNEYYKNPKRYAFTFQHFIRIKRFENLIKHINDDNDYIIMDRSLDSDKNVFGQMKYDEHNMNDIEWNIYKLWDNLIKINIPTKTIYLKCSPLIALQRIKKRNRIPEQNITLDYLTKIHNYHEYFISSLNNVLTIDCNKDFENDNNIISQIISYIKNE